MLTVAPQRLDFHKNKDSSCWCKRKDCWYWSVDGYAIDVGKARRKQGQKRRYDDSTIRAR